MSWYWFRFGGFQVEMPDLPVGRRSYTWRRIYGLGIGPWFFGAIKGERAEPLVPPRALADEG